MTSSDLVRIARQRAGLTQQQLARRSGHPRETIARWETGKREPSLASLRALVAACDLELVLGIADADDSLGALIDDQLALPPVERLTRLLPHDVATAALAALHWLAGADTPTIAVGAVAGVLQGVPQRPRAGQVEVVAGDISALTEELDAAGFTPTDTDERWAERDRRWPWTRGPGETITTASLLPGADDFRDLRRNAVLVELDSATRLAVAHPRDLLRIADASPRDSERARAPALRMLLDRLQAP